MSALERFASLEHRMRGVVSALPPALAVRLFSAGRTAFAKRFAVDVPRERYVPPAQMAVTAMGMTFRMPLWNAAGMFKNGEAYDVVSAQGAGAYVAGTTTSRVRAGTIRDGVKWPAVPYAHSHASSNWMGLPNAAHRTVASRLATLERVPGCPIGASVSAEPGLDADVAVTELIDGMKMYADAGVDYIELNESCPNVPGHAHREALDADLLRRLDMIASQVLSRRDRHLPVVVKFSNDTSIEQLPGVVHALHKRGFNGIIVGNTSTRYAEHAPMIDRRDRALYDYFTATYGGGISGAPLRSDSLACCGVAIAARDACGAGDAFEVIRCGGIAGAEDLAASAAIGVRLNQWYVGYFEAFGRVGHRVYRDVVSRMRS
jgi:dihydroorotate dehydrogenase